MLFLYVHQLNPRWAWDGNGPVRFPGFKKVIDGWEQVRILDGLGMTVAPEFERVIDRCEQAGTLDGLAMAMAQ